MAYLILQSNDEIRFIFLKKKIHVWDNTDNLQTWSVKGWSDENSTCVQEIVFTFYWLIMVELIIT